jgi:hypothetical protein
MGNGLERLRWLLVRCNTPNELDEAIVGCGESLRLIRDTFAGATVVSADMRWAIDVADEALRRLEGNPRE